MDRWNELARRAERRHGVVVIEDLVRVGASRSQVKRWEQAGRLVSCGFGAFRVAGAPANFDAHVLSVVAAFPSEAWASHRTGARLLGLGVQCPDALVEVTRPYGSSAARAPAVVHRSTRIPPHHQTVVRGIPCLSASRTVFDLARSIPALALVRVVDQALIANRCTIGSLWRVLYDLGGRGRPGTRRTREVLERLGAGYVPPASELEAVGMALLADAGFSWQVELSDDRGYIRRVDGLRRSDGVIVEFDGPQHEREPQRSLDVDGDRRLRALGHRVVRLRWEDVTLHADLALEAIERGEPMPREPVRRSL